MLEAEFRANRETMGKIVAALGADLGIQLDVGGEKMFIVDETGRALSDETAAALLVELALHAQPGNTIAVPVNTSSIFETIAGWHDGRVVRIRHHLHSLMAAAGVADVLMVADTNGNFIFPDFQPIIDGMMASIRLLQYLSQRRMKLSEVVDYLPQSHTAQEMITCPWSAKGLVMRRLNEEYRNAEVEKIDGLKVRMGDQKWIHIMPNPEKPLFELFAEAKDQAEAEELVHQFLQQIDSFIQSA
jgi:mannose-1-phosphate guanylyltransferase/phosphomannomutase